MFLMHILLALVWAALTGSLTVANLLLGFMLGFMVLLVAGQAMGARQYVDRFYRVVAFAFYFLWELIIANLRIAYDILTPTHYMEPGIVAVPLDVKSDVGITLLATFITLTPGTMSLDVSADRKVMYIHTMYVKDPANFRTRIKQGFEAKLLEIMR